MPVTAKPKVAPPVPKVKQAPKAQLAEAVAQHVVDVVGATGKKAKSMAAAGELAVTTTWPGKIFLTDTLNKIKGPPPKVVQVLVPYGAVTQVASKAPNAQLSEALLVKNVQLDPVLLLVLVSP